MPRGMPPQAKALKMGSNKPASIPIVGGGSAGSLSDPGPIPFWVQNQSYPLGQQVIFNDDIYYAKFPIPVGFAFDVANFQILSGKSSTFGKTVTVAKSNGNYDNLADALNDPVILGASSSNPVAIFIYSGIYIEPIFTVPDFVKVFGFGNVILQPEEEIFTAFCTMMSNTEMIDVNFNGNGFATGVAAAGLNVPAGESSIVTNVGIRDFFTCFSSRGASSFLVTRNCVAGQGSSNETNTAYSASLAGDLQVLGSVTIGSPANKIPKGFRCDGLNSSLTVAAGSAAVFCQESVVVSEGGLIDISASFIAQGDEGLVMLDGTNPSTLKAAAVIIDSATVLHHNIKDDTPGSKFVQSGGIFDRSKVFHSDNVKLVVASLDLNENDENFRIVAELNQGTFRSQEESNFAGGDSTVLGMSVLTNTNGEAGTTVDETVSAASASGSLVTMFPGVAAENCIYFIRSVKFGGFHLQDLDTLMNLGGGAIVFEYSSGAGEFDYQSVNVMETDSSDLDDVRANNVFVTNQNGNLEIRTGDTTTVPWVSKTLFGKTGFILRARITSAITTSPIFQQSKLHSNTLNITSLGQIQLFGDARGQSLRELPALVDLSGLTSANQSIDSNTNTNVLALNNNRASNAKDGSGIPLSVPSGIDTSFPMQVIIRWASGGAGTGDVENSVAIARYGVGDVLDGTIPETVVAVIRSIDNQPDEVQEDSFSFDISDVLPGGNINLGVFRDATAGNLNDTLANSTYIINIEVIFRRWR